MIAEKQGYEFISISWAGSSPSGKTQRYSITNNRSGSELGLIRWYSPWRQYVFAPASDTIFSIGCMEDIIDFLETLK